MRFIDMFMAALGSLVFLALLLVFLLPRTTQQGTIDNNFKKRLDDLIAENRQLRELLPLTSSGGGANTDEKNILKRWFGVLLMVNGCDGNEPDMYVRWEGDVIDFETGKPLPRLLEFDATDFSHSYDKFVGHKYFDIGNGPEADAFGIALKETDSTGLDSLSKSGLHAKLFYGVSRTEGAYSIYAGLSDPRSQGERACTIQPFYLSSHGLIAADRITMTQQRPFAWLRHFKINTDGTTTFGISPWVDVGFKRELLEFSNKQSTLLCERRSLCGTIDAHYALLLSRQPTAKLLSPEEEKALEPLDSFRECDKCPEMVVMPSGSFKMGSSSDEEAPSNENPQHLVRLQSPFAVARYAVTFDEWDGCVADGRCSVRKPDDDRASGRDRKPVVGVSFDDAKEYVSWISIKTGKSYRLLSESEREYVTRAGTETLFSWGNTISANQANYLADEGFRGHTITVDSFAPNAWGLFQLHGNVNEWTEDCYHDRYGNAPNDGTTWGGSSRDCRDRVIRGGSWADQQIWLRSSSRDSRSAADHSDTIGFRIARTLAVPNSSECVKGKGTTFVQTDATTIVARCH
jgi:formylglycine-generating enzyme required for sulfatase activity